MSYTIVTSLIDIGRSEWDNRFRRPWYLYLEFFQNIMRLGSPMVIYVEEEMRSWVEECREGKPTHIISVRLCDDFVFYKDLDRLSEIQTDPNYLSNCVDRECPEISVPLYNVIMINKIDFVARTAELNPFNTSHFVWLDAGYGHGKFTIPDGHVINLNKYIEGAENGKLAINTLLDSIGEQDYWSFFRMHVDFMSGGLFVVSGEKSNIYRELFCSVFREAMNLGIVDDDQYIMTMAYIKYPEMFHLVRIPDWGYLEKVILGD